MRGIRGAEVAVAVIRLADDRFFATPPVAVSVAIGAIAVAVRDVEVGAASIVDPDVLTAHTPRRAFHAFPPTQLPLEANLAVAEMALAPPAVIGLTTNRFCEKSRS